MQRLYGVVSCCDSTAQVFVRAKSMKNIIFYDLYAIATAMKIDVFKFCRAVFLGGTIAQILRICCSPKIFYSVVCFATVDVVNDFRKPTVMPKKNSAMLSHAVIQHGIKQVSFWVRLLFYSLTNSVALVRGFFVNKIAIRMVIKPFFQNFLRDMIGFVHAVVPYKQWCGKWRLGVDSIGPLRYCKAKKL
jgi:hypothetical protein